MSASLVGSEMCIRDSRWIARSGAFLSSDVDSASGPSAPKHLRASPTWPRACSALEPSGPSDG
eukprot:2116726-Alexandrium_andersonii.AAC.1